MSDVPNCPDCGNPGQCTDQWQRQYECHCGGGRKVFAPDWYVEQSRKYCDDLKAAIDRKDDVAVKQIMEQGKPWNACVDHDLRSKHGTKS